MTRKAYYAACIIPLLVSEIGWAQVPREELWSGLKRGMTPQEAAVAVSSISGVKKAEVKTDRRRGLYVDIQHERNGGDFGGISGYVELDFDKDGLLSVSLFYTRGKNSYRDYVGYCLAQAEPVYERLEKLLATRFEQKTKQPSPTLFLSSLRLGRARQAMEIETGGGSGYLSNASFRGLETLFQKGSVSVTLYNQFQASSLQRESSRNPMSRMSNMQYRLCERDYGIRATPTVTYMLSVDADRIRQAGGAADAAKTAADASVF